MTSSRNNETRSRGSRSAGGRVPASPGRSVCATVGKNAAQGCFHVIFWIRPRPKGGVMNRRSGCNPIRGPRSIDGERKIDDREGEKKGKKKKKKEERHLGRWPAKVDRRIGAKRGWFTCENGQLTSNRRTSPVSTESRKCVSLPGLTLNESFAAVHLVGRVPRKRRTRRRRVEQLEDGDDVGIRELHVVQRSNRNMLGAAYTHGPPKFLLQRRGEFRLRVDRALRGMEGWRVSSFLEPFLFHGRGRRPPPFEESSSVENFFFWHGFVGSSVHRTYKYTCWYFDAVKPRDTHTRRPRTELEQWRVASLFRKRVFAGM